MHPHLVDSLAAWFAQIQLTGAGGSGPGEDEAQLLNSSWGRTRTNVHGAGLDAFHFRQYLFACQARLLLALQRPVEVGRESLGEQGSRTLSCLTVDERDRTLLQLMCWVEEDA